MDNNTRVFEETELTTKVCDALRIAALRLHGLTDGRNEFLELLNKIKANKLDVRLIPRDE